MFKKKTGSRLNDYISARGRSDSLIKTLRNFGETQWKNRNGYGDREGDDRYIKIPTKVVKDLMELKHYKYHNFVSIKDMYIENNSDPPAPSAFLTFNKDGAFSLSNINAYGFILSLPDLHPFVAS